MKMSPEEAKLRARDRRLKSKYGLGVEEYDRMLEAQGGGCAICSRPSKTLKLSVDHDHKFRYFKVVSYQSAKEWFAHCESKSGVTGRGSTKAEAVREVRNRLKRLSVRGILCYQCNVGLRKYSDSYTRMEAAAAYLKRFYANL